MRKETDLLWMDGCSLQVSIRGGGGGSRITEGTGVRNNILVIQQLGLVIILVGLTVILQMASYYIVGLTVILQRASYYIVG